MIACSNRTFLLSRPCWFVTALILGFFSTPALGQDPREEITATYQGLTPGFVAPARDTQSGKFRYRYVERERWVKQVRHAARDTGNSEPPAGILNWEVPFSEFATAGMDRYFRTYCAEVPIGVVAGNTYRFEILPPTVLEAYGLPDTEAGRAEASRRAGYVRELFGRCYVPTLTDPEAARSFQIALWEIIHETQLPETKAAPFDLATGNFQYDGKLEDAPPYVRQAQGYLKSLTGNDSVFDENPDLAGRELVWMKGLVSPLAADAVAQSQFALQYVRGGSASTADAFGSGLGSLGGSGADAFGMGPVGGPGAGAYGGLGAGAGGLFGGTGSGSGGSTSPTSSTGGTTTAATSTPSSSTSTTPPSNQPPDNPTPPTNPVPAPSGLVLGLLAAGTFIGRQVGFRAVGKK